MYKENNLALTDYIVAGFTLMVPVLIGVYHGYKSKHTTEDVLVGGRSMSAFPVAPSILVTFFSAVTILSHPAEVYNGGIQIIMLWITFGIFSPFGAYLFVPTLYNLKLTSSFEYLERRFDSVLLRQVSSAMFLCYTILYQSIVIYAPSIALESIIGIPMWLSITMLGFVCTVTALGGFKAVIYTDLFQFLMLMIGMFAIMVRAMLLSGGFIRTFEIAAENGRLNLFDFTLDPFMRHNTFNFMFGYGIKTMLRMGTHQVQVQRYSSVGTQKEAIRSVVLSAPFNFGCSLLIGLTGLSIYAVYVNCDPIRQGKLTMVDQIVPYFVIQHLSEFPGTLGLFLSCVFCAVLSTFSSGLNGMAAVFWEDFLVGNAICEKLQPKTKANISRVFALVFGLVSIGFAFLGPQLGSVLSITVKALEAFEGPNGSIFVLGIFVPFANKYGAICGLLAGLCSTTFVLVQSVLLETAKYSLQTSISGCPPNSSFIEDFAKPTLMEIEWPMKLCVMSYLLYAAFGTIITLSTGMLVSILTGGCSTIKNIESIYVHPCLRSKFKLKSVPSKRVVSISLTPYEISLDELMT